MTAFQGALSETLRVMVVIWANLSEIEKSIVCDPQTSGGLLVSVSNEGLKDFL